MGRAARWIPGLTLASLFWLSLLVADPSASIRLAALLALALALVALDSARPSSWRPTVITVDSESLSMSVGLTVHCDQILAVRFERRGESLRARLELRCGAILELEAPSSATDWRALRELLMTRLALCRGTRREVVLRHGAFFAAIVPLAVLQTLAVGRTETVWTLATLGSLPACVALRFALDRTTVLGIAPDALTQSSSARRTVELIPMSQVVRVDRSGVDLTIHLVDGRTSSVCVVDGPHDLLFGPRATSLETCAQLTRLLDGRG